MRMTEEKLKFFKRLDRQLKKAERDELRDAESLEDYHFGLGSWIRNTWIYPDKEDFRKAFGNESGVAFADALSMQVLEEYQQYLKDKVKE